MQRSWTISPAQIAAVRRADVDAFRVESTLDEEDQASEWLLNSAPTTEMKYAWGAGEPYPIWIKGVRGAYFVGSLEIDPAGVVSTLQEARRLLEQVTLGLDLFESEEAAWEAAAREGGG